MIERHPSYDAAVLDALASWDGLGGCGWQLHPGDVGWFARFGAERLDAELSWWESDGAVLAVAMVDGALRTAVAPEAFDDPALAAAVVAYAVERGVDAVDPPFGPCALRPALLSAGFAADPGDPWWHLYRPLDGTESVTMDVRSVQSEAVAADRVAVQRAAFTGSTYTLDRWRTLSGGSAYRPEMDLVLYADGRPPAGVTAWSAGRGRCGLLEPLGTDPAYRGRGLGRAAVAAGCAALARDGASGAAVWTPVANTAAAALYRSSGFAAVAVHTDTRRR